MQASERNAVETSSTKIVRRVNGTGESGRRDSLTEGRFPKRTATIGHASFGGWETASPPMSFATSRGTMCRAHCSGMQRGYWQSIGAVIFLPASAR
jgi:hypothetical protein